MIYQQQRITQTETETLFKQLTDPAEILLEYRIITLDPPKVDGQNLGTSKEEEWLLQRYGYDDLNADCSVRYCILIIASDRWGSTETEFIYDVTRDLAVAEDLLKTLCNAAVTPCTARYIIEDLL